MTMVSWSSFHAARILISQGRIASQSQRFTIPTCKGLNLIPVRHCKSQGGTFVITPSSFYWNKFKDIVHFYGIIGLIPALGIILYTNIFIGPATLQPIPEGYRPKTWEYFPHPITRFIAKHINMNRQKPYEKMCFALTYANERALRLDIKKKVKYLISQRRDYQSWFYSPPLTKYARRNAEIFESADITQEANTQEGKLL